MTEPTRLLDDANAPEGAASLLRSLSAPVAPSAAKQAELAKQLASLASPAAVATAGTGTALWIKVAAVCGVLGLGAVAAVKFGAHTDHAMPSTPVVSVAAPTVAPPTVADPDAPVLAPGPAASPPETLPPLPSSARAKSPARDSLADEEALLEQARRAASSSPSQALGLLQQYQRRFPNGQLTAERMFLSVDVLTRLGNGKAARKQADALVRAFPTSVYAAQVKGQSSNPGK